MKRQDYIRAHAASLKRLCDSRDRMSQRYQNSELSPKATRKLNTDLNFTGMHINQEEERLAYALGLLRPEDARKEYRPSSFHRYDGLEKELLKTKFD